MENEIWKDTPGTNGYYQISNLGRVKTLYFHSQKNRGYNIKRETGISRSSICFAIKGRIKTAGGYIWKKGGSK